MGLYKIFTVALCVTFFGHVCLSAIIDSARENQILNEKEVGKLEETLLPQEVNLEDDGKKIKSESSDSNENSSAEEKVKTKDNSSSESSESLENVKGTQKERTKKAKQKRSLDSNQDSLNIISQGQIQTKDTISKDKTEDNHSSFNGDLESTTTNDVDVTSSTVSSDELEKQTLASIPSETEPLTTETESTAETEATTTEVSEFVSETTEETSEELPIITTESTEEIEQDEDQSFTDMALAKADRLSEQIKKILMHFRKKGVVVVPGLNIFPEPMTVEDFEQSFSVGRIHFNNLTVYGLSNFTVEHINTDVDRMQVFVLLHMKQLMILGNYTLRTFFSRSAGPFNVTLLDVDSEGVAAIETTPEGHLEASDSEMDMTTKEMIADFKNLGSVIQSMIDSVGDSLFNRIKPQILDRVNLVIRKDINEKLKDFSVKFVNKVSPVDLAFSEGRRYVKEHGYDPFNIDQHIFVVGGIVHINISEFYVHGLSRFHRAGNLSLSMDSGIIQFGVHVLTHKLTGGFKWSGQAFGISRSGKTNFTIDQLQVRALVNQSLDVRQKPQLEDLDLHLGWVKVTMDSPMTLNMMVEGIINAFPRLIKHMIVDSLEIPLKVKIQEILNKINVESFVDNNLPQLDNYGL